MLFWSVTILLACSGALLLLHCYFSKAKTINKKLILEGYLGACLLLITGLLVLYAYAQFSISERVLQDLESGKSRSDLEDLPEISYHASGTIEGYETS